MHNDGDEMNDDLSALWQTQPVSSIDLTAVKANLRSERKKQRVFMVVDSLALVPALVMLYTYWDKLTLTVQMINLFILIFAIPLLGYQLWLRRVAAFSKDTQTLDHLTQLTKQIKNNVKIAFITKHSAWSAIVFGAVFFAERYFSQEVPPEKLVRMSLIIAGISVIMIVWGVWAHKRQQRFERQLNTLQEMANHRPQ